MAPEYPAVGAMMEDESTGDTRDAPLSNPRHEAFAQALATGKPAAEAYRLAGYAEAHAKNAGSRLANKPEVKARVALIRGETDAVTTISKARALEILAEIITTPIGKVDQDHYLCQEHSRTTGEHSTTEKWKMPSKMDALKLLGNWCGWEKGTDADRQAASAMDRIAMLMNSIRTRT
jgi:hypothetical protein